MKRFISPVFSIIAIFAFVFPAFATKLTIQFKDGRSESFDSSQISVVIFSEDGSAGSLSVPGTSMIDGVWATTEAGEVTFRQTGNQLAGRYVMDNGEITGNFTGKTFDGFWIEDMAGVKCGYPRNGRFYWGKLRFDVQGNHFTGKWGYCDENPSKSWDGTKK